MGNIKKIVSKNMLIIKKIVSKNMLIDLYFQNATQGLRNSEQIHLKTEK